MGNEFSKEQVPQFLREVTEDVSVLTRMSVANAALRIRQIIDDERRQLSATMIRAILSLPIIIMATLFAGAAAVEWLANVFPLPLASVYAVAALCFALLATVILVWPKTRGRKDND